VRAAINNPTSFEVHAVIWFSLARNNNAAEIHGQLCEVYGLNVMSDSKVRHWCHLFKEGRMNVHGEERSGRPSVITDNLAEKVNTAIRGNRCFTISEMSLEFP
jgi:transposase